MIRKIIAVIAGYTVFALSAGLWFRLMGQKPHADAPLWFKWATLAYGLCFAFLAGIVLRLIARPKTLTLNWIMAGLIFLLAGLSLALSGGSHWTQLMTMGLFAPASLLAGLVKSPSS